jgi:hypothetical protein
MRALLLVPSVFDTSTEIFEPVFPFDLAFETPFGLTFEPLFGLPSDISQSLRLILTKMGVQIAT